MLKKISEALGLAPSNRFTIDHMKSLREDSHFPLPCTSLCPPPLSQEFTSQFPRAKKGEREWPHPFPALDILTSRNAPLSFVPSRPFPSHCPPQPTHSPNDLCFTLWIGRSHPVAVIEANPLVNSGNSDMMVETVREISELVAWGDKHDPLITECFLERCCLASPPPPCLSVHQCPASRQ